MTPIQLGIAGAAILMMAAGPAAIDRGEQPVNLAAVHSGLCLEIEGASLDYGAAAVQAVCQQVTHQQVRYEDSTGHLVVQHSGMCLEVSTTIIARGARIWQAPCSADAALQVFKLSNPLTAGQTVTIVAVSSAMCVDVAGSSLAEGARVVQWPCSPDSPSQHWNVIAR